MLIQEMYVQIFKSIFKEKLIFIQRTLLEQDNFYLHYYLFNAMLCFESIGNIIDLYSVRKFNFVIYLYFN